MIQTMYNQPNVTLNYANGGLDRYGRIVNHSWVKNNNALVHIVHGYDYAGNRLYRNDLVQSANSELYSYDNLGQIKSLNRGELNSAQNAVTTVNHSESWNFDKTGNWLQYTNNGNTENRTHNAANELQGIATHDANGNMTLMPGLKGKYDAWNRLVEVRDTFDNLIAVYEYNGLNQRIKKTVGSTVTKSFFNENWQELESITNNQVTSYVWGLRYIDDLILRKKGTEKLYSLADPNWNVVAVCDTNGDVAERIKYDAFGKITWLNNNFSTKNSSDYNWNRTFIGQVLDVETGLMLYRNRYYDVELGRFINRDPIEYWSNDENLYRYVQNMPSVYYDSDGFQIIVTLPPILSPRPTFIPRYIPPDRVIKPNPNFPPPRGNYPQTGPKPPQQPITKPGPTSYPLPGPIISPNGPNSPPTPPSCPKPPGDCTPERHRELQNAVKAACKGDNAPRRCDVNMSPEEILKNRDRFQSCKNARETINKECFRGGDKVHNDVVRDMVNGVKNCNQIYGTVRGL